MPFIYLKIPQETLNLLTCVNRSTNIKDKKKKLDGLEPIDNRPSTNKLQHFVQKKKN